MGKPKAGILMGSESDLAKINFHFPTVRPNTKGDWPSVDPSAYLDPTAQLIGNVRGGEKVFVGPNAVIRADEPGTDGKVLPIMIEAESNIQDGVLIHSIGGRRYV